MKVAIGLGGRSTHLPGRYRDGNGHAVSVQRTRCGVEMGPGWWIVEGEAPTCDRCRALATYDSGGKVPWWES